MKQWNVGIVGAGNIGSEHAEGFAGFPDRARITAVADVSEESARVLAGKFGIEHTYSDISSMIAEADVDAVVIAVPNRWHATYAIEAMEAGKQILLEKPMGIDLADARRISEVRSRSGAVLLLAHQMRWMGWARAMKKAVESGRLGRIVHAKVSWLRRKGIPGWGTWFTRRELSGGGPLIDIGVHMLDLALWLVGDGNPVTASGTIASAFGPKRKGIGDWGIPDWDGKFDVEDLASAFIRLDSGVCVTLDVSWASHHGRNQWIIDVIGDEGGLNCTEGKVAFLTEREDEAIEEEIDWEKIDERAAFTEHFLDCLDGGVAPETDAESGLCNSAVLEAIYRSAAEAGEIAVAL